MKTPKSKKSKIGHGLESDLEKDDGRAVSFNALAELTSSDVIAQVKMGMACFEPLELEAESDEDAA